MATVTGITKERADQIWNASIVDGEIDESGQLILKTRGGAEIVAGPIIAPTVATDKAWPVGSVFIHTTNVNPATLLGVGTWVRYANGRVLVGVDENQAEFDSVGETGGAKTHTLTLTEIPNHSHPQYVTANTGGTGVRRDYNETGTGYSAYPQGITTGGAGGGEPHNNLQPYITVYMWRRTA